MKGNGFIAWLLRTPLHVFMGNTALITVTGRKTGRKITTPVNYDRDGSILWIMTSGNRTWWRNLAQGAGVTLHLNGRDVDGFGELIRDEGAVAARIGEFVQHLPLAARSLGVNVRNGVANCEDTARVAKDRLFVKIRISDPPLR